ncbi:aldo/keto reductase [Paenibacillus terrigena]|uniref:aldo/keto reductase n=1 Tax=Paenibacillus terrigena TaxID=369333 RepID=UPI00037CE0CD|nr:aldo/keto reductase [Paenibacillus terrigena]
MQYKLLGRSGLRVSELALGTMTFGDLGGWGANKEESHKIFNAYVEAGGNFIDTTNLYTGGQSEEYVGEFISSEREKFVVATKYSLSMNPKNPNGGGNHRKSLVQSLDASLKRLKTEYIDLYWLHTWDFLTPVEEIMRALDDQVRAGKILYVGISNTPAWIVSQANTMAALQGWSPFIGLQMEYSLIQREAERDLLPMAEAFEIGVTAWSPLGGGVLSGKNKNGTTEDSKRADLNADRLTDRNRTIVATVEEIAKELGKTPVQVALNWIRQRKEGPIPILGARKAAQIRDNLGCLLFQLTQEQMDVLNKVSRIELGFPHGFLKTDTVKHLLLGEYKNKLQSPKRNG